MATFAVQYLENVPGVADIPPADARARLRATFERLPVSYVLLGWSLPTPLVKACREETTPAAAQLFLWHPLLTGDGVFVPRPDWQTVAAGGERVPGFRNAPEFTFVCPNRPAVREAVLDHLAQTITRGNYDGVFLDRIRYPSPAANPARWLACFCNDCHRVAAAEGLDLEAVRRNVGEMLTTPQGVPTFVQTLLGPGAADHSGPGIATLDAFLDFRMRSVTGFVRAAADLIRDQGLAVGLDCFSPTLTRLVGQDLRALDACGDWTKVMTYAHTLGPAGLPFELLDLAGWLVERQGATEPEALEWLSRSTELHLPSSFGALRAQGLAPSSLIDEISQARAAGIKTLLAGIELVEVEGVTHLHQEQIKADLRALHAAGADGLVLSWDLWHIPLDRLELVSEIWVQNPLWEQYR